MNNLHQIWIWLACPSVLIHYGWKS
jgi:hypothetical protein